MSFLFYLYTIYSDNPCYFIVHVFLLNIQVFSHKKRGCPHSHLVSSDSGTDSFGVNLLGQPLWFFYDTASEQAVALARKEE